jgi:hypothetical protein
VFSRSGPTPISHESKGHVPMGKICKFYLLLLNPKAIAEKAADLFFASSLNFVEMHIPGVSAKRPWCLCFGVYFMVFFRNIYFLYVHGRPKGTRTGSHFFVSCVYSFNWNLTEIAGVPSRCPLALAHLLKTGCRKSFPELYHTYIIRAPRQFLVILGYRYRYSTVCCIAI